MLQRHPITHFLRMTVGRFLLPALLIMLGACDDDSTIVPGPRQPARRTVLIYMCAQNSLGWAHYTKSDSMEIMAGRDSIAKNDRLLIFIDDGEAPRLMKVGSKTDQPVVVRRWESDINSASPETLRDVVSWVQKYYPAEEYGLVMWSHADGWLPATGTEQPPTGKGTYSFGIDVGPGGNMGNDRDANGGMGTQMNITDMATALSESGVHMKYILFDACMMQNVESDYALRHVTDYIVAAPMAISAYGADYTGLLRQGLFSERVEDIVYTYYADVVDPTHSNKYGGYGVVISCVRTAGLEELARTVAEMLPRSALAGPNPTPMDTVQHYHPYTSSYYYRPHQYDLRCTLRQWLSDEDMARFDAVLSNVVTAKAASPRFWVGPQSWSFYQMDLQNYCGVAAFVPQATYTNHAAACPFGDLNEAFRQTEWYAATGWADFEEAALSMPTID